MIILSILELLLLLLLGIPLGYLALLTLLAFLMKGRTVPPAKADRRFAVVVPAHNELGVVATTVASLKAMDYPVELFQIVVIADNCTDQTADEARAAGARVLERTNPKERGKGYALRWCFDQLMQETPVVDAFVVIDADTIVDPNLLRVFDAHLATGERVVQCADLVKPAPGAWSAEMTRLGFMLYNYVRPLGRLAFNGMAGLKGNGMCFHRNVLAEHPWGAFSKAEDLEYGLQLLLRDIPARFAPESTILATMPENAENAESQRARWEGGRVPLIKKYALPLLWTGISRTRIFAIDAFLELITPALMNMIAVAGLLFILSTLLWIAGTGLSVGYAVAWGVLILFGLFHLFGGVMLYGDPGLLKALLFLPRYALWKAMLYAKLAKKSDGAEEWVRTTRE
jgi:1,2-diacylglycerol 3-beta-glucosyltransferase